VLLKPETRSAADPPANRRDGELADNETIQHSVGRFSLLSFLAATLDRASAFLFVVVIAAVFGASHQSDLYFLALVVPTAVGGALSDAFYTVHLPIFTAESRSSLLLQDYVRRASALAAALTLTYIVVLLAVTPRALLVWLIGAPILFVTALSGVYAAFFVAERHYLIAAMRIPLATAIALCFVSVLVPLWRSAGSLASSIVAGNILALGLLVWRARRIGLRRPRHRSAKYSYRQMLGSTSSAFGATIIGGPLVVVVERALASTLAIGTVALLTFSRNVALAPVLVPTALASGIFPAAAAHHAREERDRFLRLMLASMRLATLIALLSIGLLIICRVEVVNVALQRGALHHAQAQQIARLVLLVSWSLVGTSVVVVATRAFFAMHRYRLVAGLSAGSLALYGMTAAILRWRFGIDGLALAFSASLVATGMASAALLIRALSIPVRQALAEWLILPTFLALAFISGAYAGHTFVSTSSPTVWRALATLLVSFLGGTACLALAAFAFRTKEYHAVRGFVQRRGVAEALVDAANRGLRP
jgi:peptidoglycan biosynthesis protein MviN/MurJ (putative lipid II flippase)